MAGERGLKLPTGQQWEDVRSLDDNWLLAGYQSVLDTLGKQADLLGEIFDGAQSKFTRSESLRHIMNLIEETKWSSLDVDIQAAAFEGLLDRAASEGKKGAGQYFTPRLLIESIVRCIKPNPLEREGFSIADPACGTGGFLVAAYEWFARHTSMEEVSESERNRIRGNTYFGQELVARPRKLALMNMYLHKIVPEIRLGDSIYSKLARRKYDVVLTNPPFGTRGGCPPARSDFAVVTTSKQLNMLQHVVSILRTGGRAAVVLPDNALFTRHASELFRELAETLNLHTLLRCPNGIFAPYAVGVKTNVLFFTKGTPTKELWIYDARYGIPKVNKTARPLLTTHFQDFERCFGDDPDGGTQRSESDSQNNRWHSVTVGEMTQEDFNLDALATNLSQSDRRLLGEAEEVTRPLDRAAEDLASALEDLRKLRDFLSRHGKA
jgi:type I restriction enzyme M protein